MVLVDQRIVEPTSLCSHMVRLSEKRDKHRANRQYIEYDYSEAPLRRRTERFMVYYHAERFFFFLSCSLVVFALSCAGLARYRVSVKTDMKA